MFDILPTNVTVNENDRAILQCSAKNNPEAILTWYQKAKHEIVTDKERQIEVTPEGSLIFHSVKDTDEGFYQCSAIVNDSKVSNTHWAYLKVHGMKLIIINL